MAWDGKERGKMRMDGWMQEYGLVGWTKTGATEIKGGRMDGRTIA